VASTGDYDGDGSPDLLLRYGNGALRILYLNRGVLRGSILLPGALDDSYRVVIESAEIDRDRGEEIVLRDRFTGEVSILDPGIPSQAPRFVVLSAGSAWKAIGVSGP
jgi:hypothetical protein